MAKEFFIHCASPKYQIKLHSTYVGSWSHNLNYVLALSGYVHRNLRTFSLKLYQTGKSFPAFNSLISYKIQRNNADCSHLWLIKFVLMKY